MTATPDVQQGSKMLAAFASVGVTAFDMTLTDLAGEKIGYRPGRSIDALKQILPPLLQEAARKQQNVILRPRKPLAAELVQLDDLNEEAAARIAPHCFMVLCTSPGNFQAWVAVKDSTPDFARRLRKGAGADPTASGATRVGGSLNFKTKYAPAFPVVTITHTDAGRVSSSSELESAGFVAEAELLPARVSHRVSQTYRGRRKWPSYARCLQQAPPVHQGDRPDVSKADFTWCMVAIDWGW